MEKDLDGYLASVKAEGETKSEEVKPEAGKTNEEVKETSAASPAEKEPEGTKPTQEGETNTPEDKTPYHQRWAKQKEKLREELNADWQSRMDTMKADLESRIPKSSNELVSIPAWFKTAFGDNAELYQMYRTEQEADRARIKSETIEEYKQSQVAEKQEVDKWNKVFAQQMDSLREEGKTFKEDELRDVVARYQTIDDKGIYDFRKGYEILQLEKQAKANPANSQARKEIASMTAPTKVNSEGNFKGVAKIGDYAKMTMEEYLARK